MVDFQIIILLLMVLSMCHGYNVQLSSSHPEIEEEQSTVDLPRLNYDNSINDTRHGRRFLRPTLFNIVRFPNEECLDASNQSGTCYTALECKKLGGNPSSKCAKGLGTCCIMSRTCHNSTYNKVVYFKNPSYPLTDSEQNFCDLSVNIIDADICQLRIDFLEFQIDPPDRGFCKGDKFTATASGMTPNAIPVLCGNNRNQHLYLSLPAANNQEKRSVSIVFETNAVGDYRFHLKITQIDCRVRQPVAGSSILNPNPILLGSGFPGQLSRESRTIYQKIPNQLTYPAPTGCLQYFTTASGTFESFNFGNYLNNLDYAICIERQPDTCRVIYTATDANFGIESKQTGTMPGAGDQLCPDDYLLLVAGSKTGEGQTKDRYCGGKLAWSGLETIETPVISKANGPIVIRFHSDDKHSETLKEGFRVKYEQSPTDCSLANSAAINPDVNNPLGPFIQPPVALLQSGQSKPMKLPPMYHDVTAQRLHTGTGNEAATQPESKEQQLTKSRFNGKRLIF